MSTQGRYLETRTGTHVFLRPAAQGVDPDVNQDADKLVFAAEQTRYFIYQHPLDPDVCIYYLDPHHSEVAVTPDMRATAIAELEKRRTRCQITELAQFRTAAHA